MVRLKIMSVFTEEQFDALKTARRQDPYYFQAIHYNKYAEIYYRIPVKDFKNFDAPYWSNIRSMATIDIDGVPHYEIQLGIFETGWDWENRLKYEALSFNVNRIDRFEKPEFK